MAQKVIRVKALLFLLLFPVPAFARLGESANQIESRYGQASAVLARHPDGSAKVAQFHFQGMLVEVVFERGLSVKEVYKKPRGVFTQDEATVLLEANSNGSIWIILDFGRKYQRQDLTAFAGGVGTSLFFIELGKKFSVPMSGF